MFTAAADRAAYTACMYFNVQNTEQPTSSVAVAFKSRQELKLTFSSNPKEDWIMWPQEQLRPIVSSFISFLMDTLLPRLQMMSGGFRLL